MEDPRFVHSAPVFLPLNYYADYYLLVGRVLSLLGLTCPFRGERVG